MKLDKSVQFAPACKHPNAKLKCRPCQCDNRVHQYLKRQKSEPSAVLLLSVCHRNRAQPRLECVKTPTSNSVFIQETLLEHQQGGLGISLGRGQVEGPLPSQFGRTCREKAEVLCVRLLRRSLAWGLGGRGVPVGSYPTPCLRYLLFYTTDPNHRTRHPNTGVGYEPLGRSYSTSINDHKPKAADFPDITFKLEAAALQLSDIPACVWVC